MLEVGGRLAVSDQDDLANVLPLPIETPPREPQPFTRVGVVRADPHAAELGRGGRDIVNTRFTSYAMARSFEELLKLL